MILHAPAFVYPKYIWGLRPEGSFVSRDSGGNGITLPAFNNYMIEAAGRKVRWFDLVGAGTSIDSSPLQSADAYQHFNSDLTGYRSIDVSCNSYAGLRKPSYISFRIPLQVLSGATSWRMEFDQAEVLTDLLIYPFSGAARGLHDHECKVLTLQAAGIVPDYAGVITMAVGTWAQVQIYRYTDVGSLSRFIVKLVSERQCRVYGESIDNLSGNPVLSISGGGQTFPVQVRGPADVDLAASAGGVICNGGAPEFFIMCGRDLIASDTTLMMRFDFEVPYDI